MYIKIEIHPFFQASSRVGLLKQAPSGDGKPQCKISWLQLPISPPSSFFGRDRTCWENNVPTSLPALIKCADQLHGKLQLK
jgi:hypothetical protein